MLIGVCVCGRILERVGEIRLSCIINTYLTPPYFKCYPTVALWLQKPSKNEIICKNNRKIVLEIVTVEEENYEKPYVT